MVINMEEFIFVAPNGEIYRKELIGENVRHGHVAREYMESKKLPMIDVEPDAENGYLWGKELAKNHSTFAIQNSGTSGGIYIPNELTSQQKIWIEKQFLSEIEIFNDKLLICNYVHEDMNAYYYLHDNVLYELEQCLRKKGVNIKIYNEEDINEIGNKRKHN